MSPILPSQVLSMMWTASFLQWCGAAVVLFCGTGLCVCAMIMQLCSFKQVWVVPCEALHAVSILVFLSP